MFGRLTDWRHLALRFERCAHTVVSAIGIAATGIFWLSITRPDPMLSATAVLSGHRIKRVGQHGTRLRQNGKRRKIDARATSVHIAYLRLMVHFTPEGKRAGCDLLDCHAFCQITRFIDICSSNQGDVIGE